MNRFASTVAALCLALVGWEWAALPVSASPTAETPHAVAGKLTVYRNGQQVFSQNIGEGKTKLFSEAGFDLYLDLVRGRPALEVDGPFGLSQRIPLPGGPGTFNATVDLPGLGKVQVILGLF
jgi:hypothetical protein